MRDKKKEDKSVAERVSHGWQWCNNHYGSYRFPPLAFDKKKKKKGALATSYSSKPVSEIYVFRGLKVSLHTGVAPWCFKKGILSLPLVKSGGHRRSPPGAAWESISKLGGITGLIFYVVLISNKWAHPNYQWTNLTYKYCACNWIVICIIHLCCWLLLSKNC